MARPRGAKDKAPRRKRMSHMQKTKLAITGGLGLFALGTAAMVANSRRRMGKWEKESAGLSKRTDDMIAEAQRKATAPPPGASGYKGMSRAQKSAKVRSRVARLGLRDNPLTGGKSRLARKTRASIAKSASVLARRKFGLKYKSGSALTMFFLGDYTAEFKRGPDKKPRKKRNWGVTSVVGGAVGGTAVDIGRRGYQVGKINNQIQNRFVKTGKMPSQAGVNKLLEKSSLVGRKGNVRSLKAYGAGAAAGLGAYGAYKLGKRLRDRKKGK